MLHWPFLVTAGLGFLMGSLPTGWLVARAYNVDIQRVGSGNIGATNVFRVLGKGPGIFVLLVDALKGYLACQILQNGVLSWFYDKDTVVPEVLTGYLAIVGGFAAILGHVYTPWLHFKGGKGIATSAGVLAAWIPLGFLVALLLWLLVFAISSYVSLASIAAAAALPIAVWLTGGRPPFIVMSAIIGILAIYKHRANIARLRKGEEPKVGRRVQPTSNRPREEA